MEKTMSQSYRTQWGARLMDHLRGQYIHNHLYPHYTICHRVIMHSSLRQIKCID